MSAHPSRASWPHRELHRRPQWSHVAAPCISTHPSPRACRGGLIEGSTEGASGRVRACGAPP
eukprot:1823717-Pyramimonas_sp.AAC.1